MSKKQNVKKIAANSLLKHLLLIIVTGLLLVVLVLFLLNLYTRHGENVEVPVLQGLQVREANTILHAKGLHAEVVDSIYARDAVPGAILDQRPKGGNKVKEGRSIYVTIYSRSPQQIAVPGLVDYSTRQAAALLNSMGFSQLSIDEIPAEYSGLVVAVKYRGKRLETDEKVPAGAPLTLVVTKEVSADSLRMEEHRNRPPAQTLNGDNRQPAEGEIDDSFF